MFNFKKLVVNYLKDVIDRIESGTCELSESEAMDILKVIAHEAVSKEKACTYLNMSRSRFDALVKEGKLPKGRKETGFKELVYYKDELDMAVYRMNRK